MVELECSKESRGWLDSALKKVVSASGSVHHVISRIEVEIVDIDPSTEAEDVGKAVRGFFDHGSKLELRVSLIKRAFRGNRKAYVFLEEARALKLLKATHLRLPGSVQGNIF